MWVSLLLRKHIHHCLLSFYKNRLAFEAVYIPQCNVGKINSNSVVLDSTNPRDLFLLVSVILTFVDKQMFKQPPNT